MPLVGCQYGVAMCWITAETYRDLNDPEGWRVSSLRNILLLRFRTPLSKEHGMCVGEEVLMHNM
jgi:hypothetical protein